MSYTTSSGRAYTAHKQREKERRKKKEGPIARRGTYDKQEKHHRCLHQGATKGALFPARANDAHASVKTRSVWLDLDVFKRGIEGGFNVANASTDGV